MKLVKYDAARLALAAAHRADEARDIRNKAVALQVYAKQAKDPELFRWVTEIRVRAERRTGELLRDMDKHRGGNPNLSSRDDGLKTLANLGVTRDESSLWQRLAAIPERDFEVRLHEAALDPIAMTTKRILRAGAPARRESPVARRPADAGPEDLGPLRVELGYADDRTTAWTYAAAVARIRAAIDRELPACSTEQRGRLAADLRRLASALEA